METIRFLGGSQHGKKMVVESHKPSIIIRKTPRKKVKWSPVNDMFIDDMLVDIEFETYEFKKMHNTYATGSSRYRVEVKCAYVKIGSKVKPETFWKMGMHLESFDQWNNIGKA